MRQISRANIENVMDEGTGDGDFRTTELFVRTIMGPRGLHRSQSQTWLQGKIGRYLRMGIWLVILAISRR